MRQPLRFIIHSDGAHDPTIVRAIHTAGQASLEEARCRERDASRGATATNISYRSNDPDNPQRWIDLCAHTRSHYVDREAFRNELFDLDYYSRKSAFGRQMMRYGMPHLQEPKPSVVQGVAIETAQLAVPFNDETFLALAQDRLFGLGVGWKSRARLAKYLHPYPTGLNSSSPEERLSKILRAGNPVLYVRQSYNDQHAVRHGKPSATNAESDKRPRCQFTVEQIMDGAERIPASLRDQAIRYLSNRENARSAVLNSVSLDFIKPLLPERDARSLQTLSEHSWEGIAKLLSHAEYESLRRAVKKLPKTWSRDSLVEYAEAYLAEQRLQAEDLASTSGDSEPPTAPSAAGERDDSIRFGRAVFPFKGAPENPNAYSDLVRNPSTLAAVRALRQADFEREVRGIPSGRPMQERTPKGS
jgi:hypothetical protein